MLEGAKRRWRELKDGSAGSRFCEYYDRRHRTGARRILHVAAGLLILVAGLVLLPAPGPGMVVVALGAAVLAQSSRATARILDRLEVWGRALLEAGLRWWKRAAVPARAAAAGLALVLVAGAIYGGYRVLLG